MKLKNDAMGADGKRAQNHRHGGDLHHLDHPTTITHHHHGWILIFWNLVFINRPCLTPEVLDL